MNNNRGTSDRDVFDEILAHGAAETHSSPVAKPARKSGRESFIPELPTRIAVRLGKLSGKAFLVYLLLHRLMVWKSCNPVQLTTVYLVEHGLNRTDKWRALAILEQAGLIKVKRRPRKNPLVTLLKGKRRS